MNPQFTSGEVVTAAKMNQLPKGVLGYAEITTSQAGITTGADITGLSVAVTLTAGRRIRVVIRSGIASITAVTANDRFQAEVKEGSTVLNAAISYFPITGGMPGFNVAWVGTPSAGSHTYKAAASRVGGTGTLSWGSTATQPSFILVEDIGAAT